MRSFSTTFAPFEILRSLRSLRMTSIAVTCFACNQSKNALHLESIFSIHYHTEFARKRKRSTILTEKFHDKKTNPQDLKKEKLRR